MRIVNLSHGAYFLLGAISRCRDLDDGLVGARRPVAALVVAAVGLVMERIFLRPSGLIRCGSVVDGGLCIPVSAGGAGYLGWQQPGHHPPEMLRGSTVIGELHLPIYRIFMIGMAVVLGAICGW